MENIINVNDNFNLLKFVSKSNNILKIYRKALVFNEKRSILKGLKTYDIIAALERSDFAYKYFLPFVTKELLIPLDHDSSTDCLLGYRYYDKIIDDTKCEELFLIIIVNELIDIINNNYALNTELYDVFKYKYFLPILQSEYIRMKNEDINYTKEKPFIICFESAISRMLNDGVYISNFLTNIITKLHKRMKKYKIVMFGMNNDNIGVTYKGKFTKCLIPNLKDTTEKSIIKIDKTKFDFTSIRKDFISVVEYFSKIIIMNSIRTNSITDMNRSCNDDLIENINNELYIFNSRNAKVLNDYVEKFDDKFHACDKFNIMNIIDKTINEVREKENIGFDKYEKINEQSVVEASMVEIYSMISNIESMNRDYTIDDNVFAVDINDLRNKYEQSKLHMKDIINLRNEIFNIMYNEQSIFNYDTKEKIDETTLYHVVDTFFRLCVSLTFKLLQCKNFNLSRKTIIGAFKVILDEDSTFNKDEKFVIQNLFSRICWDNTDEKTEYYKSVMDSVCSIVDQLEKVVNALDTVFNKEIYLIVKNWHSIMLKNIRHFQYFDPINEFSNYIKNAISSFDDISLYSFDLDIILNKHSIYYK